MSVVDLILAHAQDEFPKEACGLVVRAEGGRRLQILRARNLSPQPLQHAVIDPEAWVEAWDAGEVVGTYHSHPNGSAEPGLTDRQWCEATGLPMYIVGCPSGDFREVTPSGYLAPYEGRPFLYGVHDCFTIVQEWLKREESVEVKGVPTTDGWWGRGENHIVENYMAAGFTKVSGEPRRGDVLVLNVGGVACHLAVYLGEGQMLHQPRSSLSNITTYGPHWRAATHAALRFAHG